MSHTSKKDILNVQNPNEASSKSESKAQVCDPVSNLRSCSRIERVVDFINEVGMLRHTPRTGYQFLGTGSENVAEHSHRVSVIGYVLAKMAGADIAKTVFMCLFHDLAEARTGDFNYVNKMYNTTNERLAMQHATEGTGLQDDILSFWDELDANNTFEAQLAHDADQLDLLFNLKGESEKGNAFALQWMESTSKRIRTVEGKEICAVVLATPTHHWWFNGPGSAWWEKRK